MTKNVFISGGLGQDGQILIKLFKKKKFNLFIFSKKKIKNKNNIKFINSNLLDKKKLDKIFKKIEPHIVLHLAANNPSYKEKSNTLFFKENFKASKNIFLSTFVANINAKFIFCSSSQIFKKKIGLVDEQSRISIKSDYTKFRIKTNKLMLDYKRKWNIRYTNVILFNHDSKYRNPKFILPRIILSLINKDTKFLNNIIKANIFADFSHAEDICLALFKLVFSHINIDKIILSSNKPTSLNDVIYDLIKKNRIKVNINFKKIINNKCLIGNNKLAKKLLKWHPKKNIYIAANDIYKLNISKPA